MKIAVLTSGGDATGTNTAVRAVARTASTLRWEVAGVGAGYRGLVEACYPAKYGEEVTRRTS